MSKSYGMAGWRLGFAVGNAELVGRLEALQAHLRAGICAAPGGGNRELRGPQETVEERRAVYEAHETAPSPRCRARAPRGRSSRGCLPEGVTVERS